MWTNPQETEDLVTFTEKNPEWKTSFFVYCTLSNLVIHVLLFNESNFLLWRGKLLHHSTQNGLLFQMKKPPLPCFVNILNCCHSTIKKSISRYKPFAVALLTQHASSLLYIYNKMWQDVVFILLFCLDLNSHIFTPFTTSHCTKNEVFH